MTNTTRDKGRTGGGGLTWMPHAGTRGQLARSVPASHGHPPVRACQYTPVAHPLPNDAHTRPYLGSRCHTTRPRAQVRSDLHPPPRRALTVQGSVTIAAIVAVGTPIAIPGRRSKRGRTHNRGGSNERAHARRICHLLGSVIVPHWIKQAIARAPSRRHPALMPQVSP